MSADAVSLSEAAKSPVAIASPLAAPGLLCPQFMLERVIRPALSYLGVASSGLERLLLGTLLVSQRMAGEGRCDGRIGPYAIASSLHTEVWDHFLAHDPELASRVRGLASQRCFLLDPDAELGFNLAYATAIACCIYQRKGEDFEALLRSARPALIWFRLYPNPAASPLDYDRAWQQAGLEPCDLLQA